MSTVLILLLGGLLLWWAFRHIRVVILIIIVMLTLWCFWNSIDDLTHGRLLGSFFNGLTAVLLITLFTYVYNAEEGGL